MLIRLGTAFPHPVLANHTGDYGDRSFDLELEIEEAPSAGKVSITGHAVIDDPHVKALLDSGQAMFGIGCECLGTFFINFFEASLDGFSLEFSGGELRGKVDLQGLIVVAAESANLDSPAIESDFPAHTRSVGTGAPIAATPVHSFDAGLDKLASMESIFSLSSSEQVQPGQFVVELDSQRIQILVAPDIYGSLSSIRNSSSVRDVLLAALYLPALVSVLEAMRTGDYEDRRWNSIINARCGNEGIDYRNGDLVQAAQTLLASPLVLLTRTLEKES